MRFGKTLSALQLVKDQKYQHVLIMTHRPVVDEGWFEDFKKIGMPNAGYLYGSKKDGEDFDYLAKSNQPFVYFASLQDLRGSERAGGSAGDKNEAIFNCHSQLCSQMTYLLSCCNIRLFLVQNSFSSLILILSMIFRNSQQ